MGTGRGRVGDRVAVRGRGLTAAPSRAWLACAGLTALAFALRLAQIDQSLFGDEMYLHRIVAQGSLGDVLSSVHDTESTPPLHFVIAWLSVKATDPVLGVRLPSLIAGTALVPAVFALGLRTVGDRAALAGAALVAISPFGVMYGVEGRTYALLALLSALSTLALLAALERGGRGRWALFALLTAAILYSHYTGVFVVAAQGAWAAWRHRDRLRELALSYAAVALAFVPWIPSFLVQRQDSAAVRIEAAYELTPVTVVTGTLKVIVGHPFFSLRDLPGIALVAVFLAAVVVAAVLLIRSRAWSPGRRVELLIVLALATPLLALVYSLGPESVFLPRNMSSSLPAAALLIGALLMRAGRVAGPALVLVVVVVLGYGTARTFEADFQRPPYRAAADFIESRGEPGDAVLDVHVGDENPLTDALTAHLDGGFLLARLGTPGERPVLARARVRGRLFGVVPQVGALAGDARSPIRGFEIVERRTFHGFSDVGVFVFERGD